jgi:hypothetical protein
VRCHLDITDGQGVKKRYALTPLAVEKPGQAKRVRLTIWEKDQPPVDRFCVLYDDGSAECSCPAGEQGQECKHTGALCALGIFDRESLRILRSMVAAVENRQRELDVEDERRAEWAEALSVQADANELRKDELERWARQLEARSAELDRRAEELDERDRPHAERLQDLKRREMDADDREKELEDREVAAATAQRPARKPRSRRKAQTSAA